MHPSLRVGGKIRLFIVAMSHFVVARNSFGARTEESNNTPRVPRDPHPPTFTTALPPPPAFSSSPSSTRARTDSIIVSQIRPSHRAPRASSHPPFLLPPPGLQRCTAIIHPRDSQIHRFRSLPRGKDTRGRRGKALFPKIFAKKRRNWLTSSGSTHKIGILTLKNEMRCIKAIFPWFYILFMQHFSVAIYCNYIYRGILIYIFLFYVRVFLCSLLYIHLLKYTN